MIKHSKERKRVIDVPKTVVQTATANSISYPVNLLEDIVQIRDIVAEQWRSKGGGLGAAGGTFWERHFLD